MSDRPGTASPVADVPVIEELLRVLDKGQRALQMYLPNNPVYQRTLQQVSDAFAPVWNVTGRLVLDIQEDQITWEAAPVLRFANRAEGLGWQLYKDGLRQLRFAPGVEVEEIFRLLRVINRARTLTADATDDLLTLIWDEEFALISYAFVEVSGDAMEFAHQRTPSDHAAAGVVAGAARAEVLDGQQAAPTAADRIGRVPGTVDPDDFDGTLYFLDESEVRLIQTELEEEYHRDIDTAAIDALLDILETQREPAVRREVLALLDDVLPAELSTGGFRAVAHILRELRKVAARAPGLDDELHRGVLSFEDRLSTPEILEQLFRVLADSAARPSNDDVGEVLHELKPTALPVVLAHLGRIADPHARRTLESSVDSIARTQPDALAALLNVGAGDALVPAISLVGRLGLADHIPTIVGHLRTGDEPVRLAAVRALGELGRPTAITAIESALMDPERSIRQSALAVLVARGGSGGLLPRLEELLFGGTEQDWERSEWRAMFEAFATLAGATAIPKLRDLLVPRGIFRRRGSPDVRASALFALGKVRTPDARTVVEQFTTDKDAVVRSAANSVLREWPA